MAAETGRSGADDGLRAREQARRTQECIHYIYGDPRLQRAVAHRAKYELGRGWFQRSELPDERAAMWAASYHARRYLRYRIGRRRSKPTISPRYRPEGLQTEHLAQVEQLVESELKQHLERIADAVCELDLAARAGAGESVKYLLADPRLSQRCLYDAEYLADLKLRSENKPWPIRDAGRRAARGWARICLNYLIGRRKTKPEVTAKLRVEGMTDELFAEIEAMVKTHYQGHLERIATGAVGLGLAERRKGRSSATADLLGI